MHRYIHTNVHLTVCSHGIYHDSPRCLEREVLFFESGTQNGKASTWSLKMRQRTKRTTDTRDIRFSFDSAAHPIVAFSIPRAPPRRASTYADSRFFVGGTRNTLGVERSSSIIGANLFFFFLSSSSPSYSEIESLRPFQSLFGGLFRPSFCGRLPSPVFVDILTVSIRVAQVVVRRIPISSVAVAHLFSELVVVRLVALPTFLAVPRAGCSIDTSPAPLKPRRWDL